MAGEPLSRLSTHLQAEILSWVDGPTIASAACACTYLRGAAKEEALWEELCRGAWPSTLLESKARSLVSSMPGGFAKLYADALPLPLYRPCDGGRPAVLNGGEGAPAASLDLVSFVDVYYKERCVLSRVVHGVPVRDPTSPSLEYPFKLDAGSADAVGTQRVGGPPSIPLETKEEGGVGVLNWMLEEDLTLTWVLADVKGGRAVSLAAGKPTAVLRRNMPSDGEVVPRFGCLVPVEQQLLGSGAAECVVSMRCQLSAGEDSLTCMEIELQVVDGDGARLGGRRGLAVLERALCHRTRTRNRRAVEEGYRAYLSHRRAMQEKKMRSQGVGWELCLLSAIPLLLCFCLRVWF